MPHRYLVVEYDKVDRIGIGFSEEGNFASHLPIHHLLNDYHWSHLDNKHVLVSGNFHLHNKKHLEGRHDTSVMPHLASSKKVKHHLKKDTHWAAIKHSLKLSEDHTMADAMDNIEAVHGPVFSPLK